MAMRLLLGAYAFIIGLCFGSFALATAWRIKRKKTLGGTERSVCEHCRHRLSATDLIPLVSWIALRGRCRYCRKKLSPLLPAAEVLGGIFFAGSYLYWPEAIQGFYAVALLVIWMVGLVPLLILFLYDIQWYTLPNKVIHPLWAVSALSFLIQLLRTPTAHTLLMGIAAVAVAAGIFWAIFEASKGKWIGFGDVRLGLTIGLFIGTPLLAALVIFVASVIGVLVALPSMLLGKRNLSSKLPFGPLLIVALILVRLFGQKAVDWYAVHLLFLS